MVRTDEPVTQVQPTVVAKGRARWSAGFAGTPLRRGLAIVLPFVLWHIAAVISDNRLLPEPVDVFEALWDGIATGDLWFHAQLTFQRGAVGLLIGVASGIVLGVLLARVRWFESMFQPILAAAYPVPKLALFPLLVLMLGFGAASKVAMVALEVAFPVTYNTYAGVENIDRRYFWVARNVGAGRLRMFGVMLRAATPSIMASLRMAVPIMLVIMVVTELIGESRGLGFLIRQSGTDFQPAEGLAVVLLLAIVGFVLDRLVLALTRRFAFWAKGVEL